MDVALGAICRGAAAGLVVPSQEGADLSQGHCCDLEATLMSDWDHERRNQVALTHRAHLWVMCPSAGGPRHAVAGLTDTGLTTQSEESHTALPK